MIVKECLTPLIDHDYIFIDLPYYNNIGDVLIWEGTERYLQSVPFKCLYKTSFNNFVHKDIDKKTVIVMQGGGNFGDVWHEHQNFRKRIVAEYPDNKIIILPQTVFYQDVECMKNDANIFSKHKNLFICARDKHSFELFYKYFAAHIILLPDMAFFIDLPLKKQPTGRILYLRRNDKEFNAQQTSLNIPGTCEMHDWPTYERNGNVDRVLYHSMRLLKSINKDLARKWLDFYEDRFVRSAKLNIGYRFLCQYDEIYSTRLHVAILGSLMGIKVNFLDNSYGKNRNFYETWLSDLDTITMLT